VPGQDRVLALEVTDSAGQPYPLAEFGTSAARELLPRVTSDDPQVVTVDSLGVAHALREGHTTLVASLDGVVARVPVTVRAVHFASVAGRGRGFYCGLSTDGEVLCWGVNDAGQLGAATPTVCSGAAGQYCSPGGSAIPLLVSGWHRFSQVTTGVFHACGVALDGVAWCWGDDQFGQSGPFARAPSFIPRQVDGGLAFRSVSGGHFHSCGVTPNGAAYCWGDGTGGELGDGSTGSSTTPVPVAGGLTFRSVSAGVLLTCGLTTDGAAWCWGTNFAGSLGTGTADTIQTTPARVGGGLTFTSVEAGIALACGLTAAGSAYCWGAVDDPGAASETCPDINLHGFVVTGGTCSTRPVPVPGGRTFTALSVGIPDVCALAVDGTAYCWGQLHPLPTAVTGAPPLRTVTAGYFDGCGIGRDDVAYCWSDRDLVAHRVPGQP
jgi:hypothetical protein